MDRLTGWDKENAYIKECFERKADEGGCDDMDTLKCNSCEANLNICIRLAQYEDTGLEPEQVKGLKQKCEQMKERLQESPFGDDKIDEIEEALEFVKFTNRQLQIKYDKLNNFEQSQCAKLLAKNGAYRIALAKAREALEESKQYLDAVPTRAKINRAILAIDGTVEKC